MEEKEKIRDSSILHAKRIEAECKELHEIYIITSLTWAKGGFWQKNAVTLLTALSGLITGSASSQIFAHNTFGAYFTTAISLLVTLLIPLLNLHKPEERAVLHETAKNNYAALQEQALLFHTLYILDKNLSDDDLIAKVKDLQRQKDELAPPSSIPLPDWVYKEEVQKKFRKKYPLAFIHSYP